MGGGRAFTGVPGASQGYCRVIAGNHRGNMGGGPWWAVDGPWARMGGGGYDDARQREEGRHGPGYRRHRGIRTPHMPARAPARARPNITRPSAARRAPCTFFLTLAAIRAMIRTMADGNPAGGLIERSGNVHERPYSRTCDVRTRQWQHYRCQAYCAG